MQLNQLKNKKILILGFAREGLSSYKFLRRHFKEQLIGIADKKTLGQFDKTYKKVLQPDKNLQLFLGKNYLKSLEKFEVIIKTPGLQLDKSISKKLAQKNILVTSNLNIFLANLKGKVVGVTGSKGKGTTASLIYKILKRAGKKTYLVGNIGEPFLNFIKQDSPQTIYVAELSSFHLENITGQIDVGLFISFFPEHLTEHKTVANYFEAKMNLVRHIKKNGVLIYNAEDKKISRAVKKIRIKKIGYQTPTKEIDTPLLGQHNQLNIQAAIETAKYFKIKSRIILPTIKKFKGLPYRLELAGKFKGIKFYCDTLGTTPEATIKAVKALGPLNLQTLIVGGASKGGNYKPLAKAIIKAHIRTLIMLPNVGRQIGQLIKANPTKYKPHLVPAKNMSQAVKLAYQLTRTGETACLSPAGTSFDFYKNYADKGEDFKRKIINFKPACQSAGASGRLAGRL